MNYFDDENRIIEHFRSTQTYEAALFPQSPEVISIYEAIHDTGKWKTWHNSSGKSDPPPDFYSDEYGLMMDVMRVDDHTRINNKGKVCNPTNQRESQLQKELKNSGVLDLFPNVDVPIVNATTDLPTIEDHNYHFYYTAFERTVKKHIESIPLYRKNHPGYKVVFFVFDESSGYVQVDDPNYSKMEHKEGEVHKARLFVHFLDKRFLDIFQGSDIDYLIWFSPFKHFTSNIPFDLPTVCVYDVKNYNYEDAQEYPEDLIVSAEV